MKIPYLSFEFQHDQIRKQVHKALNDVFDSNSYILGKELEKFEKNYSAKINSKYTLGVGNGFDALHIAMRSLGIGEGDEVIVPANTYIATWLAVSMIGAIPVPVEPDERSYNIDPEKIIEAITGKTKAIIPVHLYGQICDMKRIMQIGNEHELFVVEDNAQAHLAKWDGKYSGTFGNINATSFYPGKNLGSIGDGGAITTDNEELFEKVKLFRNYGSKEKYYHEIKGLNSRLDEIQAAVLNIKLDRLEEFNEMRRRIAGAYNLGLKDCKEVIIPFCQSTENHVYHIYNLRCKKRDLLKKYLEDQGIQTLIHYPIPPHLQHAYKNQKFSGKGYPITEKIASESLSLPIYPGLSAEAIDLVITNIINFYKKN